MVAQVNSQAFGAGDWWAVADGDRVVDRLTIAIGRSPAADRVVVLEGEAERVDAGVTIDAGGVAAMGFQALSDGFAIGGRVVSRDRAGIGGRRRNGRVEDAAK